MELNPPVLFMYLLAPPPQASIGGIGLDVESQTHCPSTSYSHRDTHKHTHTHAHTHIGLVPVPAICVCLYVGLLYQGMCYINVWMWMNGCWNESFDIWKVQKVRLLHAVRASISLKKVYTEVCTQSEIWPEIPESFKSQFFFFPPCLFWYECKRKKKNCIYTRQSFFWLMLLFLEKIWKKKKKK